MVSDAAGGRQVKVTAEVIVDIAEPQAVRDAALAAIKESEFTPEPGTTEDDARLAEQDAVNDDLALAVDWLVDTFALLDNVPGVTCVQGSHTTEEVDRNGIGIIPPPDFTTLFPLCDCRREDCATCGEFQLSPRTAAAVWFAVEIHADNGYDDVEEHGDDPVTRNATWALFDQYPRLTWRQNAVWRRQAARAFDDLAGDLASGTWPHPTCPAEEMALHLAVRYAESVVSERWDSMTTMLADLPGHTDDFAWPALAELLFQDYDILHLFDVELDGIEDPESQDNTTIAMGDYRPNAWFDSFENMTSRDPRRPFRR